MRGHKKTKESGFFEGDSSDTDVINNMGKALKRSKVYTASDDSSKRKADYTTEELDTHIRQTEHSKKGIYANKLTEMYTFWLFSAPNRIPRRRPLVLVSGIQGRNVPDTLGVTYPIMGSFLLKYM